MTEVNSPPKTRKAWRVVRKGHPKDALILEPELSMPTLQTNEVLIEVHAAALNPVGYKLMRHMYNFMARRPHIAEYEFAGVVADSNGTEFSNGESVYGMNPPETVKNGEGAISNYIKTSTSRIVHTPDGISAIEVCGLSLVGLTALYALEKLAKVQSGQTIFINGGGTSVGRAAIEIAKANGCTVLTSCSTSNIEAMKALGADEVFDYTVKPLHLQLLEAAPSPPYHAFLEAVGLPAYELYAHSPSYLDPKGLFMSVIPQGTSFGSWMTVLAVLLRGMVLPRILGGVPRKYRLITFAPKKEDYLRLQKLVSDRKVKPLVDSTHKFEDIFAAYDRIMSKQAKGKVVVTISRLAKAPASSNIH